MGGFPPLGYDLPSPGSRALVVNEAEAETVRTIFRTHLELGSGHALQRWLDARGVRSKRHVGGSGRVFGGQRFSRGALFHLLRNWIYLGVIVHRGVQHAGMHPAVVANSPSHRTAGDGRATGALTRRKPRRQDGCE